jgi:acyl transferase domain-containing protein
LSKKNSGRFLAGISSFGAGGSNAHLIVECWNEMQSAKNKEDVKEQIIVLSAQSREQLIQYAEKMEKYITHILESDTVKKDYTIANIAYTLKTGREHFSNRLAMVVSSIDEFRDKLRAFIKGAMPTEGVFEGVVNGQEKSGANAVKAKESNVIASRWVMGEAQLTVSENKNVKNVPLPTYPFLKERSWFTDREVLCADKRRQNSVLKLHPLIDLNVSDLTEQKYMVTFSGREFYLADHHIGNEKVLPAVAYIEMVRAAGELASGKKVQKVRNIVLLSPIKSMINR